MPLTSPGAVAVVTTLLVEGAMSRADLARRTGLTPAAVTKVVAPLADAGYLGERGPSQNGSLGRPSSLVDVRASAAFFAGFKVTDAEVIGVLVDFSGQVRASATRALRSAEVDEVVDDIGAMTEELCSGAAGAEEALRYVSVAVSGDVDRATGLVSSSPFLRWRGVLLGQLVQRRTGLPAVVDNDVRALTAGEQWFGAGAGMSSFAVVTIGAGIGCALCTDGRILSGAHGVSGELGHLPVADPSRSCYCGGHGCVETVASTASLLRDVSAAAGTPVQTLEEAVVLGAGGDDRVLAVFAEVGRVVGLAIASVVNLVGPQCVVLTGEGLAALDLIEPSVRTALASQAYGHAIHSELIVRPLTFEAWARGAATVALQRFVSAGR
jgi:predicted NBD/HSP70 family sugar kinase